MDDIIDKDVTCQKVILDGLCKKRGGEGICDGGLVEVTIAVGV